MEAGDTGERQRLTLNWVNHRKGAYSTLQAKAASPGFALCHRTPYLFGSAVAERSGDTAFGSARRAEDGSSWAGLTLSLYIH